MRSRRRTWMLGGIGLIACAVIDVVAAAAPGLAGAGVLRVFGDVVYAAAVLLFAVGLTADASVVRRGPLGVVAMTIVAVWPLVASIAAQLVASSAPATWWSVYGYVALVVPAGAGLVAAMRIARAAVVPDPWRWAPLWVLGVHAAAAVLPQIFMVASDRSAIQSVAGVFSAIGMLSFLTGTLGLGILALVLAASQRPDTVEIFRSA
ncbi:hypothetical protein M4I32_03090 [Microbacterium sp. LRZ72]|uniref:hypothetical protein n=1 Tax=Microbacterium sp. LRZ72 TaxID=2942481 RepID=UPI0029B35065|nr:hypothetical protein [Microbacterium sp. LRZ72]MDX2375781.1 hypothetical protein [Microbacterium sp. LRZ72]